MSSAMTTLQKIAASMLKQAGYNQGGASNNNWKGKDAKYSAKHKRGANGTGNNKRGSKCVKCGSTTNLQYATVHGSKGKTHMTLCKSCHAKYDNIQKNTKTK